MSARVEAAAKALCATDYEVHFGRKVEYPDALWDGYVEEERDEIRRSVTDSLAAADQIMFSEAAIERAVLFTHTTGGMSVAKCREIVRAVVAALREET